MKTKRQKQRPCTNHNPNIKVNTLFTNWQSKLNTWTSREVKPGAPEG